MRRASASRRTFLQTSAGLVAATMAPAWFVTRTAVAAQESKNDRPTLGAIGVGSRGSHIAAQAAEFGDMVAVCDVDRQHAEAAKERVGASEIYEDYRRLLDRNDIEAVTIGTPDHWHTAICIAAMKAGKDVYCEKPLTLTIEEGRQILKTIKETGRILQVGTQQRSDWRFRLACELVRNGRLGKLQKVTVTLPDSTLEGGSFETKPVPAHLNWGFWLGQAPSVNYIPERCHYTFRWWYEYSGGVLTDWGAHHMDIAHWAMDMENSGPVTIDGKGTLPEILDGYNTPKYFTVDMTYPNDVALTVNIGDNGVLFEGDAGRMFVNRGRITGKPVEELEDNPLPEDRIKLYESDDHMGNFIECIKERKEPASNALAHHRTVSACHLANISLRLGRKLNWDAEKEQFVGDDEANSMRSRPQRPPHQIQA